MIVVAFEAKHLRAITEQPATAAIGAFMTPAHIEAIEQSQYAFTALVGEKVLGCGGVVMHWPGRGEAWAILDADCGRYMAALHKAVKRFFEVCPVKRVEIVVGASFGAGHRWARMLGFRRQSWMMEAYLPTGEDAVMYARVQGARCIS